MKIFEAHIDHTYPVQDTPGKDHGELCRRQWQMERRDKNRELLIHRSGSEYANLLIMNNTL